MASEPFDLAALSTAMSTRVDNAVRGVGDLTITTQRDLDTLGEFLTTVVRPMMAEVDATFDPVVKAAYLAHKQAVAAKAKHMQPLTALKGEIDTAIGKYHRQVQIAREQAAKDIEAAAKLEADEMLAAQAAALFERGDDEAAQAVLASLDDDSESSYASASLPAIRKPPKTAGVSVRESWSFEIVDEGKLKREFTVADESSIRRVVAAMGEKAVEVVGVGSIRVYKRTSVASSTR